MRDVSIIAEAASVVRASELAKAHLPSVILAPAELDGASTVQPLCELRHRLAPSSKIVVIANCIDCEQISDFTRIGVTAQLLWTELSLTALPHLIAGLLSSDITMTSRTLVDQCIPARQQVQLSERELKILRNLADGLTYKEIAQVEMLSRRTVARLVGALEVRFETPTQFTLGLKVKQYGLLP
jgi:DNA-binding NarL/FixJ family response regulator